jgi:hypothetical protein
MPTSNRTLSAVIKNFKGGFLKTATEKWFDGLLVVIVALNALFGNHSNIWEAATLPVWLLCGIAAFHMCRATWEVWLDDRNGRVGISVIVQPNNQPAVVSRAQDSWLFLKLGAILLCSLTLLGIPSYLVKREAMAAEQRESILDQSGVTELDKIFGAQSEIQLRQYFGFPQMLDVNIAMNKARREHFLSTGDPNMDLTPFTRNHQMQFSSAYDMDSVRRTPGPIIANLDISSVSLLILSDNYSKNKADLLKYENSAKLPPAVVYAVRKFDDILQNNTNVMQDLLNDAMRKDPNYFLLNGDASNPKYYDVINTRYWDRFDQLRPFADQIRDNLRKAEGND